MPDIFKANININKILIKKSYNIQIDLTKEGEVNYRDKGYFGAPCAGFNATMNRAVREHPLNIQDKRRNQRIARKRSPGKRPYVVLKAVFHVGHTLITMVKRVNVKNKFSCFSFDLFQLRTLKKQPDLADVI
jgi:IS5 family transposase